MSHWDLRTLGTSLFERYKFCGETELLLDPCLVEYQKECVDEKKSAETHEKIAVESNCKPLCKQEEEEEEVVVLGSDDDIVILDDDSDDNDIILDDEEEEENLEWSMRKILDSVIANVVSCVDQREKEQSCEIVSPIVSDIVDSVTEFSTKAFMQRILCNVVDSSVTENYSFISNLSSLSKRKTGVSQFLSEVPLDLIEKRRSTRAKGTPGGGIGDKYIGTSSENTLSSPRCEEITAKQLLLGYFPSTLLNINHGKSTNQTMSPEKKSSEDTITILKPNSLTAKDKRESHKWLSIEEEKEFVESFIRTFCSTARWNFLTQLEEFLTTLAEKLGDRNWSKELSDIYLKCYVKWRGHTVFPDEFAAQVPHRFIPVVIIANEILLQIKFNENSKVLSIQKLQVLPCYGVRS